jgi:hypothetical protein
MYQVIDTKTGRVIRTYAETRVHAAYALADRMDATYGAVRYVVRPLVAASPVPGSALDVGPL